MKTANIILLHLKKFGPHSAKMLADKLEMTTMGIRQHMQQLENRELVCYEDIRAKVGRPTRFWSLTPTGHGRFPNKHGTLSNVLLESVQEIFGPEGLNRLILSREDKLYNRYAPQLAERESLEEKLALLAELRQQDGYMAELLMTEEGKWMLVENHCPINVAAHTCGMLCNSELKLFYRLFGSRYHIERTEHIVSGARRCAYVITPLES